MTAGRPERSLTALLQAAAGGEASARAELVPLVYGELKKLAKAQLGRTPIAGPGRTLQATALVHEAFLRLVEKDQINWEGRSHFFFAAARAMHDILVEAARRKARRKHGAGWHRVDPNLLTSAVEAPPHELLALSEAMARLEKADPRKHSVVLLRFFAGLTAPEVAELLGVTSRTVERDWRFARARLFSELSGSEAPHADT